MTECKLPAITVKIPLTHRAVVDIFPTTIVPASLVGLTTKLAGLVFANQMGGLVDIYPRLQLIRWTIAAQKVCIAELSWTGEIWGGCAWLTCQGFKLLSLGFIALLMAHWGSGCLVGVAACSASLALANTVLEVAVERDWYVPLCFALPTLIHLLPFPGSGHAP